MLPATASTSSAAMPIEWARKLFDRLDVLLGTKMADLYAGVPRESVESEWSEGLAGFRGPELARGLLACRQRRFALTLGEFMHLCRPSLDPEYAWHEAQDGLRARDRGEPGVWSHPAVWRAAREMGYEIRRSSFQAARRRWEMVLRREFEKGWGDDVPPVPQRVEHRPTFTPMPAAVQEKLASLRFRFKGV